jgi:Na+-driven multidrug efflux pump
LVAGIVFTGLGYLAMPHVLALLIQVPEVRDAARAYLGWRLLGITSMAMTFAFKAFFDGIGKTHVHMISSVVMNVINVFLCIAFIFGRWGAPRMGMAGAGLAGFVSTWVGLAIMIGWALLPRYTKVFEPFAFRRVSFATTWDVLRLSIPSAVATVAVMTGFALFAMIVSHLDAVSHAQLVVPSCPGGRPEPVNGAATMLIVGVLKLTFTACLAFGTSTATLVSQSLGEGAPAKAVRFGWVSVRLGLVIFGVVGLLEGVLFTRPLLTLVTHSPAVLEAALGPMRLMGVCTPLIATGMILTQALFGAGNTRYVMLVELILHFGCLVPLAWLLGITLAFGLPGIWAAATVYVVLLTAAMVYKFRSGDWQGIRL